MLIISSLKKGVSRANRSKRVLFFLLLVNILVAAILAGRFLASLNNYMKDSVMEERLQKGFDLAWYSTYQYDFQKNEDMTTLSPWIFGYSVFFNNTEAFLNGNTIKPIGNLLKDLIFRFKVNAGVLGPFALLGLLYVLIGNFASGGLLGIYNKSTQSFLFREFLESGARYFGRFFRISLVALILYFLFFVLIVDPITNLIPFWTANAPSEVTPFVYYMVKNAIVLLILLFLNMTFDYAKIKMVVEDRASSVVGVISAFGFCGRKFFRAYGLYLLIGVIGLVFIVLYSWIESVVPQTSFSAILFVFLLQQLYMFSKMWLKGTFYASQLELYKDSVREKVSLPAAEEGAATVAAA
jgi:hypothetical protein